jgi:hypothetical protein
MSHQPLLNTIKPAQSLTNYFNLFIFYHCDGILISVERGKGYNLPFRDTQLALRHPHIFAFNLARAVLHP